MLVCKIAQKYKIIVEILDVMKIIKNNKDYKNKHVNSPGKITLADIFFLFKLAVVQVRQYLTCNAECADYGAGIWICRMLS